MNAILKGLVYLVFFKVMQCKTTKHAWEKLKITYEGASKVKKSKIQTYKGKFESLKMKEEENIAEYLLTVDEIVNVFKGLGGEIKEKEVVEKVLRTLPIRYNPKVYTVEDQDDLELWTVDELHGIFTAYEMRIGKK